MGFHTESNQAMNLFVQNIAMVLLNTKHEHEAYLEEVIKNPEKIREIPDKPLHREFEKKFVKAMQFLNQPFFEKKKFNKELETLKEKLIREGKTLLLSSLTKLEKMMNTQFDENCSDKEVLGELQKQYKECCDHATFIISCIRKKLWIQLNDKLREIMDKCREIENISLKTSDDNRKEMRNLKKKQIKVSQKLQKEYEKLQKQYEESDTVLKSENTLPAIISLIEKKKDEKTLESSILSFAIQMHSCMGFKYFNINLVDYLSSCAEDQFLTFVKGNKEIKEEIKHAKTHTMFHAIYKGGDETLCPCIKCQMHMPQNLNEVFQV